MKQLIILFAVVCFACNVKSQDKLITQKGDVKTVYVVEIAQNNIFYKLENTENASLQQIAKKDVLTIIHRDGSKELFNTSESVTTPLSTSQPTPATTSVSSDRHPVVVKNGEYVPVQFIDEKSKKKNYRADISYVVYLLKNGSIVDNDDVEIEYKIIPDISDTYKRVISYKKWDNYKFHIVLQNKTDKTIYIDLGNTFIIRGSEATAYYIPSATSNGIESSSGRSVNLGGIGNAFGVSGAAGSVLGAINVGGSSSNLSTTTTYAQRIIAIPPMSSKSIQDVLLFPSGSDAAYQDYIKSTQRVNKVWNINLTQSWLNIDGCKMGKSIEWDENNSPINFSFFVSYAFQEACIKTYSLNAKFYVKQIIGLYYYYGGEPEKYMQRYLSPDWKEKSYFIMYNGNY